MKAFKERHKGRWEHQSSDVLLNFFDFIM
jgi:hypothetical protein